MRNLAPFLLVAVCPALACGQSAATQNIQFRGHYIGEPIERFLHLEGEAREDVDVCQQHPTASVCVRLFGAIERGDRTEISTSILPDLDHPDASGTINFVLEGKKLVKLTMLVNDPAEVTGVLGNPSSESVAPTQNKSGEKWANRVSVWDTPTLYATLYWDNNPSLEDKRPIFVMESREEHARETAANAPKSVSIKQ